MCKKNALIITLFTLKFSEFSMIFKIFGRFVDRTWAMRMIVAVLMINLMALLSEIFCCWNEKVSSLVFMMISFFLRMAKKTMKSDVIEIKMIVIDDYVFHMSTNFWVMRMMKKTVFLNFFKSFKNWVEINVNDDDDTETN